jgi:hypothetical protein
VSNASSTPPDPDLVVVIMRDVETGTFRLPDMVDVYVELKARE